MIVCDILGEGILMGDVCRRITIILHLSQSLIALGKLSGYDCCIVSSISVDGLSQPFD